MEEKEKSRKTILHMDGDAFFASVEIAKNPKLEGLPVVTGEERGIASSMSYEAKALGITRAMPIYKIKKQFPSVVVLPGDYKAYAEYSKKMFEIVSRYADEVEEYSIDECFADLTGLDKLLKMRPLEIASRIKFEIRNELGISVSIGLAPTKVLAKVASSCNKPNGLTFIPPESINIFLKDKPIEKIWGIGPRTASLLKMKGISTALEFTSKDILWVKHHLSKPYEVIWEELRGSYLMQIDTDPKDTYSSIQKMRTFHPPTCNETFLFSQISKNIEDVCAKARYYNLTPKKFSLYLKTQRFSYNHIVIPLIYPTSSPEILLSLAREKFPQILKNGVLYRATGVTLHDLTARASIQPDLFGESDRANKFDEIHRKLDLLEEKLGKKLVHLGSTQTALNKKTKGTDMDDFDRHLVFL